jgi:hypothetical protein
MLRNGAQRLYLPYNTQPKYNSMFIYLLIVYKITPLNPDAPVPFTNPYKHTHNHAPSIAPAFAAPQSGYTNRSKVFDGILVPGYQLLCW